VLFSVLLSGHRTRDGARGARGVAASRRHARAGTYIDAVEWIDGEPVLDRPSVPEVEAFFETAGPSMRAVWLRLTRTGVEPRSLTADELVDVGLCFGWVSAVRRSGDGATYLQRYARRRPGSRWSRRNIAAVERLTAEGRMRPGGVAEVEAAQADGRWANPWT
jgi:uncharacterized protein YdeI (YjbR/CyaY-like superfamily)